MPKSNKPYSYIVVWILLAFLVVETVAYSHYDKRFVLGIAFVAWCGGLVTAKLAIFYMERRNREAEELP